MNTFTKEVKKDILNSNLTKSEFKSLLIGFFVMNGHIKKDKFTIRFSNDYIKKRIYEIFQNIFGVSLEKFEVSENYLEIPKDNKYLNLNNLSLNWIIVNSDNPRATLAGMFLARGYISSPESIYYHFEIRLFKKENLNFIKEIFEKLNIKFNFIKKKNWYFVYVKKSSTISDILKLIFAYKSTLEFEQKMVERNFMWEQKKLVAIETYNVKKIIDVSTKQCKIIEKIMSNGEIDNYSSNYRNLAKLRLKNPEYSLNSLTSEFNKRYNTSYSRSSINSWLNKLTRSQ